MKKNKNIRNYIYALLILIVGILLIIYIFQWYNVKNEERLMNSYLISTKTINSSINNLNSLTATMQEAPTSYFIYFGFTGNKDEYNLERGLKRVIDKYKINDIFYYIDLTNMINDSDYLNKIKKSLSINNLNRVPAIIYINNNKVINVLDSSSLSAKEFEKLLNDLSFNIIK